ncbi:helix-turn-helix domain-containing protein [Streptomyces lydicus]|uniref:helix-turn-helix domain-containing protein n=1 Tax=Streptomyces lydicus TaxID=47763 RepID=UPI0033CC918C
MQPVRITRMKTKQLGSIVCARITPHPAFPKAARLLGGIKQMTTGVHEIWAFDAGIEDRVRTLCLDIWGTDGSLAYDLDTVTLRWTVPDEWEQELWLAGRFVARRDQRDAPVRLGRKVTVLQGGFWPAGGSKKNPRINPYDGTVVEIRSVPRAAADRAAAVDDDVTVIETDEPLGREELRERRDQLLDDLRTINGLLDEHVVPSAEPLRCRCGRHECPPEGYTVTEIAELVGVTANTVSAWCRTGALAAHRVGGRWIVPEPLPERVGRTRIPSQRTARMPPDEAARAL